MLRGSYTRSDAFYYDARYSCSVTNTRRRADNASQFTFGRSSNGVWRRNCPGFRMYFALASGKAGVEQC